MRKGEENDVNWWYVVLAIWAIEAINIYRRTSYVIDGIKEKNPNVNPIYYDIAAIGLIILWPIMIPSTIKKVIQKLKAKREE